MVANPGSGTSHLKRHLDIYPAWPSGYQCGDEDSDDGRGFVFNTNELCKEIVLYIVEGAHSFATVDEQVLDE